MFKNDDAVKQHVLKFLHTTDKDLYVAQATRDLLSARKVVLNCRESMLRNNIIVVLWVCC